MRKKSTSIALEIATPNDIQWTSQAEAKTRQSILSRLYSHTNFAPFRSPTDHRGYHVIVRYLCCKPATTESPFQTIALPPVSHCLGAFYGRDHQSVYRLEGAGGEKPARGNPTYPAGGPQSSERNRFRSKAGPGRFWRIEDGWQRQAQVCRRLFVSRAGRLRHDAATRR